MSYCPDEWHYSTGVNKCLHWPEEVAKALAHCANIQEKEWLAEEKHADKFKVGVL